MAWLQKQSGSNNWYIGFRLNGKEQRVTTGTSNKAEAQAKLDAIESMESAKRANAALEAVYEALSGKSLPRVTLAEQLRAWLAETKRSVAPSSQYKYESTAARLIDHLKATDKGPLLADITQPQLQDYFETRIQSVSATSVNLDRTILRIFFKRATDTGLIKTNPILHIEPFRDAKPKGALVQPPKKTFTNPEMRAIYQAAPSDFWRYMILAGYYTGMRMGDLITLRIEEVDMQTHWIRREMGKVRGKFVQVPIVPDLHEILRQQILERAAGHIWPKEAALYEKRGAVKFSLAFTSILTHAGIVTHPNRTEREDGDDRRDRGISFHLLRHTFVSELKNSGVNASVAKALVGHSTDAINELYTHIPTETLSLAVKQLPGVVTA